MIVSIENSCKDICAFSNIDYLFQISFIYFILIVFLNISKIKYINYLLKIYIFLFSIYIVNVVINSYCRPTCQWWYYYYYSYLKLIIITITSVFWFKLLKYWDFIKNRFSKHLFYKIYYIICFIFFLALPFILFFNYTLYSSYRIN